MTRQKQGSRVGGGPAKRAPTERPDIPSMRKRRPVMYWIVVFAVMAMVLGSFATFLSVIL